MKTLSIIIPVYNEAALIQERLKQLKKIIDSTIEIIVVDGVSNDESLPLARALVDRVLTAPKGRALQMNAGAKVAQGRYLLFLHIDTQLPESFLKALAALDGQEWGFFAVALSGQQFEFRIIECMMNVRSRLTAVATGDQCIFVKKELFEKVGGFKNIPLMEDVDISKRFRKMSKPYYIKQKVITSSRRWEEFGIWKTVFLMWRLRFAFFMGVDPTTFSGKYYPHK